MREIKFRAWDTVRRKMIRVGGLWDMHRDGEDLARGDWSFFVHDKGGLLSQSDYEFMQYTGLKDKNGVEMYDGDIVKTAIGLATVRFQDGAFCFSDANDTTYLTQYQINERLIEVIGNIYEHAHLLEKQP